jgi:predicted ester cyclase
MYAPYCVLQRAPVRLYSGRPAIAEHYANWRRAFPDAKICVDHVCSQPFTAGGNHIAVRWSLAGLHEGPLDGHAASAAPVYVVGVTHWRVIGGRIITEWTVFDELAVLAQIAGKDG